MASTPKKSSADGDESIKETLESVVMAFVLAFVFRAYVVEAFVIPTGSMAPTLLGEHVAVHCTTCGYHFTFDVNTGDRAEVRNNRDVRRGYITDPDGIHAICPECHFPNHVPHGTRIKAGDRILVHKYIYSLSEPRRWDVVVFKNPSDPEINFIKRLAGLPNERLWIIDGNVYAKPLDEPDAPWRIQRKSERPKVQRAVWQPIYHSDYVPLDGGGPSALRRSATSDHNWTLPWQTADPGAWDFTDQRSYACTTGDGEIEFSFPAAARGNVGWYPYNQFGPRTDEPIEDVRVAAGFAPQAAGLGVRLSTTIRGPQPGLGTTMVPVIARVDDAGAVSIVVEGFNQRVDVDLGRSIFPVGRATDVELWYVDQEASVWIDGRRVAHLQLELDLDTLIGRPEPAAWPDMRIGVTGAPVTMHRVEVDRDLYYTSSLAGGGMAGGPSHRGTLVKWIADSGQIAYEGEPVTLDADQFFCLGDNSPRSSDSRYWKHIDPWIRRDMLGDNSDALGIVPRKLMMGRAFFVYFPAMHNTSPNRMAIIPNFGDMRFIH